MTKPYKTLRFGPGEIPNGLRTEHVLKEGVCAELVVTKGSLAFVDANGQITKLAAGERIQIPGGQRHHLEHASDAAITLAFFRKA